MSSKEIQKTLKLLMKMPMHKELINENKVLTERIRSLEYAVQYLESKNAKLEKKLSKKQKVEKIIDLSYDDDDEENGNISIVIEEPDENTKKNALDAKYPDYQEVVIKRENEELVVVRWPASVLRQSRGCWFAWQVFP